jgi:hypothetical protein
MCTVVVEKKFDCMHGKKTTLNCFKAEDAGFFFGV